MKYRCLVLVTCLFITACDKPGKIEGTETAKAETPVAAKSDKKKEEKSDAAEAADSDSSKSAAQLAFDAADKKYSEAREEFMKEYQALPEEEREAFAANFPKPGDYADDFMKIAEANPDDAVALDALLWVAGSRAEGDATEKAYEVLFEKHMDNEKLGNVCFSLMYSEPSQAVESRIKTLMEKSPHDQVKALATFALANYYGQVDDGSVNESEIVALYEKLGSDYADLKINERSKETFGDMAKNFIFELKNLSVGKVAPEIEGEDLDGKTFKLSEYRGKVVVLDFWGDW